MSISLVGVMIGLPILLTARVVMGEEKFNEWLDKDVIFAESSFKSDDELISTLKSAGYNTIYWMNSLKTHYRNGNFFFWDIKDGKYIARMNSSDGKDVIFQLIQDVNNVAGRSVFRVLDQTAKEKEASRTSVQTTIKTRDIEEVFEDQYPTIYSDVDLLVEVLKQNHLQKIDVSINRVNCYYEGYNLSFIRENVDEAFDMRIRTTRKNMKRLYDCMDCINGDYYTILQDRTYHKIKEQLLEEDMMIESEEITEDNAIVLTVVV